MADSMVWGTPIAAGLLAFALFGIDEIGVEIEDPFGYDPNDLPMERIGDVIDGNTREIVSVGARE
jgi:putative membrane protein